jgi:hypothetical protein
MVATTIKAVVLFSTAAMIISSSRLLHGLRQLR